MLTFALFFVSVCVLLKTHLSLQCLLCPLDSPLPLQLPQPSNCNLELPLLQPSHCALLDLPPVLSSHCALYLLPPPLPSHTNAVGLHNSQEPPCHHANVVHRRTPQHPLCHRASNVKVGCQNIQRSPLVLRINGTTCLWRTSAQSYFHFAPSGHLVLSWISRRRTALWNFSGYFLLHGSSKLFVLIPTST